MACSRLRGKHKDKQDKQHKDKQDKHKGKHKDAWSRSVLPAGKRVILHSCPEPAALAQDCSIPLPIALLRGDHVLGMYRHDAVAPATLPCVPVSHAGCMDKLNCLSSLRLHSSDGGQGLRTALPKPHNDAQPGHAPQQCRLIAGCCTRPPRVTSCLGHSLR